MTRVLYIEDNEDNMLLVERALLARGHELIFADNGLRGLEVAAAEQPDLILLDINLPDINGYEVVRRLRAHEQAHLREVPVIAVTANALKGDAEKAIAAGCNVYMSKPINIRELWAKVSSLVPTP